MAFGGAPERGYDHDVKRALHNTVVLSNDVKVYAYALPDGKTPIGNHAESSLGIGVVGATIFSSLGVCTCEEGIWTFPIA